MVTEYQSNSQAPLWPLAKDSTRKNWVPRSDRRISFSSPFDTIQTWGDLIFVHANLSMLSFMGLSPVLFFGLFAFFGSNIYSSDFRRSRRSASPASSPSAAVCCGRWGWFRCWQVQPQTAMQKRPAGGWGRKRVQVGSWLISSRFACVCLVCWVRFARCLSFSGCHFLQTYQSLPA